VVFLDITRQLKRVIKLYERFVDTKTGYKMVTSGTTKLALITNEEAFRKAYETPDSTFAGAVAFRCVLDADGLPLAGAVITIQKGTETPIVLEATDVDGLTGISNLKAGTYSAEVTTTPEGYATPTIADIEVDNNMILQSVVFTVSEDGSFI
jgi:uncharacterized surface anchored protein